MSEAIKVFSKDRKEYKRLQAAAKLIEAETYKECRVDNILFDAGQNWMWTTISIESDVSTFPFVQALTPRQQNDIVYGSMSDWLMAVQEVIKSHEG